jgi:hypothetical protein
MPLASSWIADPECVRFLTFGRGDTPASIVVVAEASKRAYFFRPTPDLKVLNQNYVAQVRSLNSRLQHAVDESQRVQINPIGVGGSW